MLRAETKDQIKTMNPYVYGRAFEYSRLAQVRKQGAVLGGRFRGSKVSSSWIKHLGFNPKIDIWWIDRNGVVHFEQLKRSAKAAKISASEKQELSKFAALFPNYIHVSVDIVLKSDRKVTVINMNRKHLSNTYAQNS
jgi:hypothetical protein